MIEKIFSRKFSKSEKFTKDFIREILSKIWEILSKIFRFWDFFRTYFFRSRKKIFFLEKKYFFIIFSLINILHLQAPKFSLPNFHTYRCQILGRQENQGKHQISVKKKTNFFNFGLSSSLFIGF